MSTFSGTQSGAACVARVLIDRPFIDSESAGVKGPQCEDVEEAGKEDAIDSAGEKRLDAMESAGDTMLFANDSRGIVSD